MICERYLLFEKISWRQKWPNDPLFVSSFELLLKMHGTEILGLEHGNNIKGTHTICLNLSFHNVNQMLISPRTIFIVAVYQPQL